MCLNTSQNLFWSSLTFPLHSHVSPVITFIIVSFVNIDLEIMYSKDTTASELLLWAKVWASYYVNVWLKQTKREYLPVITHVQLKDIYVLSSLVLSFFFFWKQRTLYFISILCCASGCNVVSWCNGDDAVQRNGQQLLAAGGRHLPAQPPRHHRVQREEVLLHLPGHRLG